MSEETSDALTGHYEGKVSRDYGEYYVDSVLRPAIESMLSPFDIKQSKRLSKWHRSRTGRDKVPRDPTGDYQ